MYRLSPVLFFLCLSPAIGYSTALGPEPARHSGTTHYMRADGTAPSKARATGPSSDPAKCMNVSVHNAETFTPGDTITICGDGGPFVSQIRIPSSGSPGRCISYVGHNHPVLYGGRTVTDHNLEGWTADDLLPGVYSRKIKDGGQIYYEDHIAIRRDGHLASHNHVCTVLCKQPCPEKNKRPSTGTPSCREGNWFISGAKLYYKPTSGTPAAHLLEYSKNTDWGVNINDNSDLDLSGIAVTQWWIGISEEPTPASTKAASHITIHDCRGFDLFTAVRLIGINSARARPPIMRSTITLLTAAAGR